jgi:hypothetical protein
VENNYNRILIEIDGIFKYVGAVHWPTVASGSIPPLDYNESSLQVRTKSKSFAHLLIMKWPKLRRIKLQTTRVRKLVCFFRIGRARNLGPSAAKNRTSVVARLNEVEHAGTYRWLCTPFLGPSSSTKRWSKKVAFWGRKFGIFLSEKWLFETERSMNLVW